MRNTVEIVECSICYNGANDIRELKEGLKDVIRRKNYDGARVFSIAPITTFCDDGNYTRGYVIIFEEEDD